MNIDAYPNAMLPSIPRAQLSLLTEWTCDTFRTWAINTFYDCWPIRPCPHICNYIPCDYFDPKNPMLKADFEQMDPSEAKAKGWKLIFDPSWHLVIGRKNFRAKRPTVMQDRGFWINIQLVLYLYASKDGRGPVSGSYVPDATALEKTKGPGYDFITVCFNLHYGRSLTRLIEERPREIDVLDLETIVSSILAHEIQHAIDPYLLFGRKKLPDHIKGQSKKAKWQRYALASDEVDAWLRYFYEHMLWMHSNYPDETYELIFMKTVDINENFNAFFSGMTQEQFNVANKQLRKKFNLYVRAMQRKGAL